MEAVIYDAAYFFLDAINFNSGLYAELGWTFVHVPKSVTENAV